MQNENCIEIKGPCKIVKDIEGELNINFILQLQKNTSEHSEINIPSNWELQGINNFSGTLWYIFEMPSLENTDGLKILRFTGVDYFTDVWVNEKYIGSHEGYFQKFIFDITEALEPSEKNLLVVKVTSPKETPGNVWPNKKQLIKGIFNHHDCRPGGWNNEHGQDKNTGGIWNSIFLHTGINCFIDELKITPRINWEKNQAMIRLEFSVMGEYSDTFTFRIISPEGEIINCLQKKMKSEQPVKITHEIVIDNPQLWNPWELGNPLLYEITISCEGSNTITEKFGIREITIDEDQTFFINRQRLFLRGTNIIPTQFLSELDEKRIHAIVTLLLEANINIVRVHAHVNRKEFYKALDESGILVWQDFALQWTYDDTNTFCGNAVKQITDMVNQFYNHPSIVFWCCHNEPGEQINTLDHHLENAVKKNDDTRIIRRASNYEEHPYDGWYWGDYEHFNSAPMGPLVTEFGAQALPEKFSLERTLSHDDINKLNWEKWEYHNFQYEQTFNVAEIELGKNIDEFIQNSQTYQVRLLKRAIDFYRRKKNHGITGIFQFMFIDCWPSITWSVVDYFLKKKPGFVQLKKSYQPLYISIELRQQKYNAGFLLQADIWLINDLHKPFADVDLEIQLNTKVLATKKNLFLKPDSVCFFSYKEIEARIPTELEPGDYEVDFNLKQNNNIISCNDAGIKIVRKMTTWS